MADEDQDSYEARAAARAAKRASRPAPAQMAPATVTIKKSETPKTTVAAATTAAPASTPASTATTTRRRFRESDFDATPTPASDVTSVQDVGGDAEEEKQHKEEEERHDEDTPRIEENHNSEQDGDTYEPADNQVADPPPASQADGDEEVAIESTQSPPIEESEPQQAQEQQPTSPIASHGLDLNADLAAINKPKRASRRFGGEDSGTSTTATSSTKKPAVGASSSTNDKFADAARQFEQASTGGAGKSNNSQKPPLTSGGGSNPALKPRKTINAVVDEDSEAAKLVKRIVDLEEDATWGLFDIQNSQLTVHKSGSGTVEDLRKHVDHSMAVYGYLRMGIGAEQRQKFVFIRWVGDKITPMTRARILNNEALAKTIIKIVHVEVFTSFTDELTVPKLSARLAKAAGANYDKAQNEGNHGSNNTAFSQYKFQSRDFFASKEREGTVKSVVYTKAPLPKTTPVDLNARKFTVGATQGQKNIVLAVPGVDTKKDTEEP